MRVHGLPSSILWNAPLALYGLKDWGKSVKNIQTIDNDNDNDNDSNYSLRTLIVVAFLTKSTAKCAQQGLHDIQKSIQGSFILKI